jgi:hypothetical protein
MADNITLVSTWGLTTSNVYASLAEAKTLVASYVLDSDEWDNADDTFLKKCLLIATKDIDSQNWHGERYYWNQNLQFPRIPPGGDRNLGVGGDATSDGAASYYSLLLYDEYSRKQADRVKLATVLQAHSLLVNKKASKDGKGDQHRDLQKKGISSWSMSGAGVSESYSYGSVSGSLTAEAWDQLRYYKGVTLVVRGSARGFYNE